MSTIVKNLNYLPVRLSFSSMDWLGTKKIIRRRVTPADFCNYSFMKNTHTQIPAITIPETTKRPM